MIALIIAPFVGGTPQWPDGMNVGWQLQTPLYDDQGVVVKAVISIDTTQEVCDAIKSKTYPTLDWIGSCDPSVGQYLNVAETAAKRANDIFAVKLAVLTRDGYTDPVLGFTIKGDDRAMKERWTPQVTSVLNMRALGVPGSTQMTTFDAGDRPIQMTLDEFQAMMMRFTLWFNDKFTQAAS